MANAGFWPRTGCSVIVVRDGKVLLVKRGKEPFRGCWSLPGGGQEAGETLEDCARRELREETGLEAGALEFVAARDRISRNDAGAVIHHFVLSTFFARDASGEASALDDALDAGWFTLSEMKKRETTPGTIDFLRETLGDKLS